MPEKINLDFGVKPTHFPPPTLSQVISAINSKPYSAAKKKELIAKAQKTPSSGMRQFLRNMK